MITAASILAQAEKFVLAGHHVSLKEADARMAADAIGKATVSAIAANWAKSEKKLEKGRFAAYISAEFLTGRAITNNLNSLGILGDIRAELIKKGLDIDLLETEEDAALGNGGLGRLAACFLDSAAAMDLPLIGYGLKYRYGLFRQGVKDFCQTETEDDWTKAGDAWSVRRDELAVTVKLDDGDITAVPYDMPVIGWKTDNVGTLRLWQTESKREFAFELFNDYKYADAAALKNRAEDITKVLYPNDWDIEGKRLRLKQEYVLSSASVQDILRRYDARHKSPRALPKFLAVQLNDTHPVLAIPELIRLLMKRGMTFRTAADMTAKIMGYTNHTVMPEALEKWDMALIESVNRDIAAIIRRIDRKCLRETGRRLISDGRVSMAEMAVYMGHAVNGVAKIHSELVKTDLFPHWYERDPGKFQNKTNGITPRRWLSLCNPELTDLLQKQTDADFIGDLDALSAIKPTAALAKEFAAVKQEKKRQLSAYIAKTMGVDIPETFIFDIQVKRLHEYKRQLLNALSLYDLYMDLKSGVIRDFTPTAFLFAGKAAPGYARAKAVIRYINALADKVNNDPEVNRFMRVCFIPNYNCSAAEKIIPAADYSEQISPAGTEASGTGNMKFMLNGAVTVGTYDGANIEIAQAAGEENEIIFGARIDEIKAIRDTYRPRDIYESDARVKRAVDSLTDAGFPDEDGFLAELRTSLLDGASWHKPDHYFLLKDFESYREARLKANALYGKEKEKFDRMCLNNILSAGIFSSDRTVRQYAEEIWHIEPMK